MRRLGVLVIVGVVAVVAVGFADRNGSAGSATLRPTYFRDVKPILDARCSGCHIQGGIAPFRLNGYLDAYRHRKEIAEAVQARRMPPWHADSRLRRYLHDPRLTNAQIDILVRWAGTRAPRGDAARPGRGLPSVAPRISRVDARIPMGAAYTPQRRGGNDDYRCFVLPWSPDRATHVTGSNVQPGQRRQVHHIILYLVAPGNAGTLDAWQREDSRPGYGCYGGPSATGRQSFGFQFLAGWVPGSFGTDFSPGTGIRVAPGSRLVLQVHYNLQSTPRARPDRSTVQLKLDESVQRRAVYAPLVDAGWVLSPRSFRIPAKQKRIPHSFVADPRGLFRITSGMDFSKGFDIHSLLLHMHRLGKGGEVAIERSSGTKEVLLKIPRWDFNWQREYHLASSSAFSPGDRLSLRCEHSNPTRTTKTWGENSSDEMCIAFLYVSER